MKVLIWLYNKVGFIGCILLSVVLLLLFYIIYLHFSLNSLQKQYIDTTNILANTDSLKQVLQYDNKTLSERYAKQYKDLSEIVDSNKILKKYIKDKNIEVKSLVNKVEQLKIENQVLAGKVITDSLGNKSAYFDTTTQEYSLQATAQIEPKPCLTIHNLLVIDSSSVGIGKIDKNGLLTGFITHSNKSVKDINADFSLQLTEEQGWQLPAIQMNLILIPISIGVGALATYLLMK